MAYRKDLLVYAFSPSSLDCLVLRLWYHSSKNGPKEIFKRSKSKAEIDYRPSSDCGIACWVVHLRFRLACSGNFSEVFDRWDSADLLLQDGMDRHYLRYAKSTNWLVNINQKYLLFALLYYVYKGIVFLIYKLNDEIYDVFYSYFLYSGNVLVV